ncbi:hypothetical protein GGR54DRAFT_646157 [Hypoxylon sp. NC1633]|nr:hypothetical protein GGR54DRAFT_646157 [Hypoxylon sp. NC1633]
MAPKVTKTPRPGPRLHTLLTEQTRHNSRMVANLGALTALQRSRRHLTTLNKTFKDQIDSLKQERIESTILVKNLNDQIASLQQAGNGLAARDKEYKDVLISQENRWQEYVQDLEARNNELKTQVDHLNGNQASDQDRASTQWLVESQKAQLAALQQQINHAKQDSASYQSSTQQTIASLQAQNASLSQQVDQNKTGQTSDQASQQLIGSLRAQLTTLNLKAQNASLSQQIDQARQDNASYQSSTQQTITIVNLQAQNASLSQQVDQNKIGQTSDQASQNLIESLRGQLAVLNQRIIHDEQNNASYRSSIRQTIANIQAHNASLSQQVDQNINQTSDQASLQLIESLRAQNAALNQQQISIAEDRDLTPVQNNKRLESQINRYVEKIRTLEKVDKPAQDLPQTNQDGIFWYPTERRTHSHFLIDMGKRYNSFNDGIDEQVFNLLGDTDNEERLLANVQNGIRNGSASGFAAQVAKHQSLSQLLLYGYEESLVIGTIVRWIHANIFSPTLYGIYPALIHSLEQIEAGLKNHEFQKKLSPTEMRTWRVDTYAGLTSHPGFAAARAQRADELSRELEGLVRFLQPNDNTMFQGIRKNIVLPAIELKELFMTTTYTYHFDFYDSILGDKSQISQLYAAKGNIKFTNLSNKGRRVKLEDFTLEETVANLEPICCVVLPMRLVVREEPDDIIMSDFPCGRGSTVVTWGEPEARKRSLPRDAHRVFAGLLAK